MVVTGVRAGSTVGSGVTLGVGSGVVVLSVATMLFVDSCSQL